MLLSAVSVLVVAQSSSEFPEGLMNNPVYQPRIWNFASYEVFFWLRFEKNIVTNADGRRIRPRLF